MKIPVLVRRKSYRDLVGRDTAIAVELKRVLEESKNGKKPVRPFRTIEIDVSDYLSNQIQSLAGTYGRTWLTEQILYRSLSLIATETVAIRERVMQLVKEMTRLNGH